MPDAHGSGVTPLVARVAEIPRQSLAPFLLLFSLAGSYTLRRSPADVCLTAGFGLLGCGMKRGGYSPAPMVLGLVLGPLAEQGLQGALRISNGSCGTFFHSPMANVLWALLVGAAALPWLMRRATRPPSFRAAL